MSLRRLLAVVCVLVLLAEPAAALQRFPVRIDDPRAWHATSTVTIRYYNICTGWIWAVNLLPATLRYGVVVDTPDGSHSITSSWHYIQETAPFGSWGFTGTISIDAVDGNDCPAGMPIASQPYLLISGWNAFAWNTPVPSRFVLYSTDGPHPTPSPLTIGLDHPSAAPGTPAACGACYPSHRVNRSFQWGTVAQPACPGTPLLFDGTCDAQLLWDCDFTAPDDATPATWARIKAHYR